MSEPTPPQAAKPPRPRPAPDARYDSLESRLDALERQHEASLWAVADGLARLYLIEINTGVRVAGKLDVGGIRFVANTSMDLYQATRRRYYDMVKMLAAMPTTGNGQPDHTVDSADPDTE